MACVSYSNKRLGPDKLSIISRANDIISGYGGQRLTLRQLYYQFVTRNWITNEEKSYKRLANIISDARLCGHLDWNAIEDRGRSASVPWHYDDADEMISNLKAAAGGYTLDKWRGQETYVELWVEKQALAGILAPIARRHHVTLMVNKGYSSQSAMYESAQRFRDGMGIDDSEMPDPYDREATGVDEVDYDPAASMAPTRSGLLLYLGDFDPSGEDMVRDIRQRLGVFGVGPRHDDMLDGPSFEVRKIGLTMEQIRRYRPPPNPAKVNDPRAAAYIAEHGNSSWEVDALPPEVLNRIVDTAIAEVVDRPTLQAVLDEQERDRKRLVKALEKISL